MHGGSRSFSSPGARTTGTAATGAAGLPGCDPPPVAQDAAASPAGWLLGPPCNPICNLNPATIGDAQADLWPGGADTTTLIVSRQRDRGLGVRSAEPHGRSVSCSSRVGRCRRATSSALLPAVESPASSSPCTHPCGSQQCHACTPFPPDVASSFTLDVVDAESRVWVAHATLLPGAHQLCSTQYTWQYFLKTTGACPFQVEARWEMRVGAHPSDVNERPGLDPPALWDRPPVWEILLHSVEVLHALQLPFVWLYDCWLYIPA